jgi:hypothetical protein
MTYHTSVHNSCANSFMGTCTGSVDAKNKLVTGKAASTFRNYVAVFRPRTLDWESRLSRINTCDTIKNWVEWKKYCVDRCFPRTCEQIGDEVSISENRITPCLSRLLGLFVRIRVLDDVVAAPLYLSCVHRLKTFRKTILLATQTRRKYMVFQLSLSAKSYRSFACPKWTIMIVGYAVEMR